MIFDCLDIDSVTSFDWDVGNIDKNERKHGLKWNEIEEIFFNEPLIIVEDLRHSEDECRCFALGRTDEDRAVYVAFTLRRKMIRVISARPMNRKERRVYEEAKNDSAI